MDEFGEYATRGGVSHRELTRVPGIKEYQELMDAYDGEIQRVISERYDGLKLSSRSGPDKMREYGFDSGNGYGNTMLTPGGPGGKTQTVIYDW